VGGVNIENMSAWYKAGANGFGVGSALYKPGKTADAVKQDAERFVAAYDACLKL